MPLVRGLSNLHYPGSNAGNNPAGGPRGYAGKVLMDGGDAKNVCTDSI